MGLFGGADIIVNGSLWYWSYHY